MTELLDAILGGALHYGELKVRERPSIFNKQFNFNQSPSANGSSTCKLCFHVTALKSRHSFVSLQ